MPFFSPHVTILVKWGQKKRYFAVSLFYLLISLCYLAFRFGRKIDSVQMSVTRAAAWVVGRVSQRDVDEIQFSVNHLEAVSNICCQTCVLTRSSIVRVNSRILATLARIVNYAVVFENVGDINVRDKCFNVFPFEVTAHQFA